MRRDFDYYFEQFVWRTFQVLVGAAAIAFWVFILFGVGALFVHA